ncbi:NAD(P)/FAD-dependent oxidoreductase [Oceaniglobus roseus]|uniref:NAD(P)/FAD-dependent oxidoreductase n=1 Tax=Oceaniglobus roseus TaxID=1737570 RepID=UPI000C7F2E7A|nr:FAD-dependent oxidoreductase [Kandeliimicrobium roseum]
MILVIGGGIAGVSAAARLSALGPVTVLEAESALAYHASGRSAALFIEDYGNDSVKALNRASRGYLAAQEGVTKPRGLMMLARADQEPSFEEERIGFGMERLAVDEAQGMFPILNPATVAHVGYRADVDDIDTDLLIQGFARQARANGATFVTGARVSSISREGGGWVVRWPGGEATGDLLVNAAGAWADGVARMAGAAPLGLQPYRRSMARLPAPGGHDTKHWPFVDGVEGRWYAKPDAGGWIVSPSEEDPMDPHDAFTDDMVIAEGLDRYSEMVTEPVVRVETTWAGLRTFAPDRTLVIGPDAGAPGFFWCAGQGGYGFQTCAAASQLLADLVGGRASELPGDIVAGLAPGRFG